MAKARACWEVMGDEVHEIIKQNSKRFGQPKKFKFNPKWESLDDLKREMS